MRRINAPRCARPRVSTFRFGDIEDLHQLVTTTDAPAEILAQIRELGVHVITVPAGK